MKVTSSEVEAVSLCEASEVKMEDRFEIFGKFHVIYSFAVSRHDCVGHPKKYVLPCNYEAF